MWLADGRTANQAGLSRLYGGIHFEDDNVIGQAVGLAVARQAWEKALTYFGERRQEQPLGGEELMP